MTDEGRAGGGDERPTPGPRHSSRFRFPKSARLTRTGEFQRVRNEGKSFHGRFIVLSVLNLALVQATVPLPLTRIGFITSRRVGSAVIRNRVRRRLRELVRVNRPQLRDGFFLVLVARARAAGATFEALEREWISLARRASILKREGNVA